MTHRTWRRHWLERVARLLGGEPRPRLHGARRLRVVPFLEQLETRLAPATTFSIADSSVIEPAPGGTVNLDFTVTRTGDLTSQVTVGFTTVAGTAQPNTDYTPTTGTTTFAWGSPTATIAIPVFGNGVFNSPSLTFSVQLTGIVNVVGPPVTFAAHSDFTTGTNPISVAVGDINGDGRADLVVANFNAATVSVLLNTTTPGATTPSFAPKVDFATGMAPISVAIADLNRDGKADIVVASSGSNCVSVLLNTTAPGASTPSFAPTVNFATGTSPSCVAVADFNGDGLPDLVVSNRLSNSVSVLLNTTTPGALTPTFTPAVDFAAGATPSSVAVADFNGDGLPDIVVANEGNGPGGNNVSVLLNTTAPGAATPSFAPAVDFATGLVPVSVAVGDLNGDGKPDIVVANALSDTVSVLLNTTAPGAATPSFAAAVDFATDPNPTSVTVGDLNGDGKLDIVVADQGLNTASVLLNTTAPGAATPSFAPKTDFTTGPNPVFVAIADFNGDGLPDLAVANVLDGTGGDSVSVLLNTTVLGAATIVPDFPQAAAPAVSTGPVSVAVGDLNGDGKPDLVVANYGAGTVSVLLNTTAPGASTPSFATAVNFSVGNGPISVAIGDLNGDGKPDIVVANSVSNTVSVLLNTTASGATTPSFAAQQSVAVGSEPLSVVIGDLNGDGKPDIVVANLASDNVSVLLNMTAPGATTLSFATQQTFATDHFPISVAIADLNGDGKPDIVTANNGAGTVSVLLNTTAPGATTPSFAAQQTFAVGFEPYSVAIADLNGDGKPDLVVANLTFSTVSVLLNTTMPGATTPSFATGVNFTTGANPTSVAVADLNGDGKPDIVTTNHNTNTVSVLLNTTAPGAATPSFATKVDFTAGANPISVAVADLNGDGRPDLAIANIGDDSMSVLLNTPEMIANATATGTITESDLPPSGDVVISGTGGDDTLLVERTPGAGVGSITYILNGNAPVLLTDVTSFTFDGMGGDDTMTVSKVNGGPLVPGNVFFDGGGAGSNALVVDASGTVTRAAPGLVTFGDPQNITYVNVATLNIDNAASVGAIAGPDTADRATAFTGLTAPERFVQALYLDELGRAGTQAELDGWVAVLNAPGGSQTTVATSIDHSVEARDHLVKSWYVSYLGRPAAGGEEQGWVNALLAGQSEEQVLSGILGSPEFYNRAQTLISSGTADQRFVQALYLLLLNRTGEASGVAGWVAAVPLEGRQAVGLGFLTGPADVEFRTDQFEGYYNALLHRPSDPTGLNGWVMSNLDMLSVRIGFESSPEFFVNG